MKKQKTSMTTISKYWKYVFSCGYCDLQNIFNGENPQYYNSGVYGWNCDIYCDYEKDIAITTGYRNTRGKRIPHEIIKKYDEIAKEIKNKYSFTQYENMKKELAENKENFLQELLAL